MRRTYSDDPGWRKESGQVEASRSGLRAALVDHFCNVTLRTRGLLQYANQKAES